MIRLSPSTTGTTLWKLGVQVLLQLDAELLPQGLQLLQVLLVLALVLDLGLDACLGTRLVSAR